HDRAAAPGQLERLARLAHGARERLDAWECSGIQRLGREQLDLTTLHVRTRKCARIGAELNRRHTRHELDWSSPLTHEQRAAVNLNCSRRLCKGSVKMERSAWTVWNPRPATPARGRAR